MREIKVGAFCSPSKFVSKEEIKVKEFKVSHGGGMGGANYKYYGVEHKSKREGFIKVKTFDGKELELNQRFIVSIKPKKVIAITYDITEHRNYDKVTCKSCIETMFVCIDPDDVLEVVDEFFGSEKNKSNCLIIGREVVNDYRKFRTKTRDI